MNDRSQTAALPTLRTPLADFSLTLLGLGLVLGLPALASAALPKTGTKSIVPGKSIGGLGLGGTQASVEKAWGKYAGGDCEQICTYGSPTGAGAGEVRFETPDESHFTVFEVSIVTEIEYVGGKDVANCDTPLAKFETSKKIHLCSTAGAVKKAYPKAIKEANAYILKGPGKVQTRFALDEADKVFSISITSRPPESE
jgi:hypothetical protein